MYDKKYALEINNCYSSYIQSNVYFIYIVFCFIEGINNLSHINLLFHGIIVGIIIFQTSVIAPTVFKTINSEETSRFLRIIFPKFFIFIGALGAMSLLVELLYEKNISTISTSVLTVLVAFLCYAIIPSTNSATDEGNQKKFKKLHFISVLSTMIILLLNIAPFFVAI